MPVFDVQVQAATYPAIRADAGLAGYLRFGHLSVLSEASEKGATQLDFLIRRCDTFVAAGIKQIPTPKAVGWVANLLVCFAPFGMPLTSNLHCAINYE